MSINKNINRQASFLSSSVKQASQAQSNVIGSVVNMGMFLNAVPRLPSISYVLDNSATAAISIFFIGDPTNMIRLSKGFLTAKDASQLQGNSDLVEPNKKFFFSVGIVYSSINYQVSRFVSQFSQPFVLHTTNSAGELLSESVNMASAQRNSAFNPNLLTLTGEYMLDVHRGIQINVLAFETVTLTFTPSTYTV